MTKEEYINGFRIMLANTESLKHQLEPFNKNENNWLLPVADLVVNSKNNQENLEALISLVKVAILNLEKNLQ